MRPVLLGSTLICDFARMSPLYGSACWMSPRWAASAETGGGGGPEGGVVGVAVRWQATSSTDATRAPPITTCVEGRKRVTLKSRPPELFCLAPRVTSRILRSTTRQYAG